MIGASVTISRRPHCPDEEMLVPFSAERHSTLENASLIFSFWVIGCFGAVATGMQLRVILMSAMTGMTALQRLLSFALLNWT